MIEATLVQQDEARRVANTERQWMIATINGLWDQLASAASVVPASQPPFLGPACEPRVGEPERYALDPDGCDPLMTNCSILFAMQPHTFTSEAAKVTFTVNHLTGRARLWGTAEWETQAPACGSFQTFTAELRMVFGGGR